MRSIWSLLHLLNRWTIQFLIHASFFRSFLYPFMDWFNQSCIQSVGDWSFRWHFNSRLHMCYRASQPQHWIPCILTGVLMGHRLLLIFNPCCFLKLPPHHGRALYGIWIGRWNQSKPLINILNWHWKSQLMSWIRLHFYVQFLAVSRRPQSWRLSRQKQKKLRRHHLWLLLLSRPKQWEESLKNGAMEPFAIQERTRQIF